MTLADVCKEFEKRFYGVSVEPAHHHRSTAIVGCSGALGVKDLPPPVLCATPALAVELFRRTINDYADDVEGGDGDSDRRILTWITEPQLLKFKMTIQEINTAHRIASSRYAVYSLLLIGEPVDDAVLTGLDRAEDSSAGQVKAKKQKPKREIIAPAVGAPEPADAKS